MIRLDAGAEQTRGTAEKQDAELRHLVGFFTELELVAAPTADRFQPSIGSLIGSSIRRLTHTHSPLVQLSPASSVCSEARETHKKQASEDGQTYEFRQPIRRGKTRFSSRIHRQKPRGTFSII